MVECHGPDDVRVREVHDVEDNRSPVVGVDVVEDEHGLDCGVQADRAALAVEHHDAGPAVGVPLEQVEHALGPGGERTPERDVQGRFDQDDVVGGDADVVE